MSGGDGAGTDLRGVQGTVRFRTQQHGADAVFYQRHGELEDDLRRSDRFGHPLRGVRAGCRGAVHQTVIFTNSGYPSTS